MQVPALWEALWTNTLSPHLHVYVALALLQYKRHTVLSTGAELHTGHMHSICGNLRGTVGLYDALQVPPPHRPRVCICASMDIP